MPVPQEDVPTPRNPSSGFLTLRTLCETLHKRQQQERLCKPRRSRARASGFWEGAKMSHGHPKLKTTSSEQQGAGVRKL